MIAPLRMIACASCSCAVPPRTRILAASSKLKKPERHLQIIDVDYLGEFAERCRVLVVRVQQDDMRVRMFRRDRRQDQRRGAGFAGAGRAEHRKMPGEQRVHQQECRPLRILKERADAQIGARWRGEDGRQLMITRTENGRA